MSLLLTCLLCRCCFVSVTARSVRSSRSSRAAAAPSSTARRLLPSSKCRGRTRPAETVRRVSRTNSEGRGTSGKRQGRQENRSPPGASDARSALCLRCCSVSGVMLPLPNSSRANDNTEYTLGEHKLALVHVGATPSPAQQAAIQCYARAGGQVYPTLITAAAAADVDTADANKERQAGAGVSPSAAAAGVATAAASSRHAHSMQLYADGGDDDPSQQRQQRPRRGDAEEQSPLLVFLHRW